MNKFSKSLILFLNIVLPLIIGKLVYFIFTLTQSLPIQLKFYLPDAFWYYSFTFSILILQYFSLLNFSVFIFFLFSPIIIEFTQLFHFFPGTFDKVDIIVYYLSGFIAYKTFNYNKKYI